MSTNAETSYAQDVELIRYAINASEIKQQDAAWDAFNRILSALAAAEAERDALRAVARRYIEDFGSEDGMCSPKVYAREFSAALNAAHKEGET